jgi:hypothetical protein
MFKRILQFAGLVAVAGFFNLAAAADDLHFKNNVSVEGNTVSTSETWVNGTRERTVTSSPVGSIVTLRQCDLKRTVTINEQSQSFFVAKEAQEESVNKAAALLNGGPAPASGGSITQTVTITDTGERKQMSGYAARRLKTTVVVESSADACSKLNQTYDIDGWYADLSKEQLSCVQTLPPVKQGATCSDRVIIRRKGTGKSGYPLRETISLKGDDGNATKIDLVTSDISKQAGKAELFEVPQGFHEVHSETELYIASMPQVSTQPTVQQTSMSAMPAPNPQMAPMQMAPGMNPRAGAMSPMAMLQSLGGKMPGSAAGMQGAPAGAPIPIPQAVGPKAPGKIRIGIAPAQAQLGQGNNSQEDFGTPVRNAIILMMSGPAVEITALDARLPIQTQAEAQQKECDFVLISTVTVKRSSSSGFGKFMKAGSMAANFTPIGMMAHSMNSVGGMLATQAATSAMQTAAMTAPQMAMSQLSGFNGQIKSKDEVTVQYQLLPTGQTQPKLDNTLKGKSKSDGEDVLTPLIQQAANNVLIEVTKR